MGTDVPDLHSTAQHALSCKIIEAIETRFDRCPCVQRSRQLSGYPATRTNAHAPEFASYIYIYLFIYIYKREYLRGCVFSRVQEKSFLQAGFSSAEKWHILWTDLTQPQYLRGFAGSLKVGYLVVHLDIWQN